jgi:hypothetical protein
MREWKFSWNEVNFVVVARFSFISFKKFNQVAGRGIGVGKSFQVDWKILKFDRCNWKCWISLNESKWLWLWFDRCDWKVFNFDEIVSSQFLEKKILIILYFSRWET